MAWLTANFLQSADTGVFAMKKAIKQTTMVSILNTVCIVLLVGIAVFFGLDTVFTNYIENANDDRFDLTYYANMFMDGSATLTDEVRAYSATGDKTHYDLYMNEVNTVKSRETGVENMKRIGLTDEESQMIEEMQTLSDNLVPLEERAMEFAEKGKTSEALDYVYGGDYAKTLNTISELQSQFQETLDKRTQGEVTGMNRNCNVVRIIMLIFLIALVFLQFVQNTLIRRKVIKPVLKIRDEMLNISKGNISSDFPLEPDTSEIGMLIGAIKDTKSELQRYIGNISEVLSKMSKGNMNFYVDMDYIGDFRPIKESLEVILDSMNGTLANIDDASKLVASHSDQVASGAQALAQGATEQASTVEELSATINELTQRMSDIAGNADKAKKLTVEAESTLYEGNRKMDDMKQAMDDISSTSQEIEKIIKTIEDIAFQTNILALNAAVEAARAGAAGKGFAVVADEVRNLANKSKEASGQTTMLIENSAIAVERGVRLTEETAQALNEVVKRTKESSSYVEAIAGDSEQQAKALQQVNVGVDQISSVVQTNSATSEQSAAASQELNNQAGNLQKLVSSFHLREKPEFGI